MITITEDYAIGIGRNLEQVVLSNHFEGFIEFSRTKHPAVGTVVKMCTEEEYREKLDFAIAQREGRCESAISAFESNMEGGE